MRPPFHIRLAIVATAALALGLPAFHYVATHDLERSVRQFSAGEPVTWPPAPKPGNRGVSDGPLAGLLEGAIGALRLAGLAALALGAVLLVARAARRRRRGRELGTYELRLGRDDLAHPFRVQAAFEGIIGAISVRWYQRLFGGQGHFALELHRLPDRSIRYTLALPRPLAPAVIGPLEDLYPDVRPIEVDGRPDWCASLSRLKKRRSHVLSLQTLRNYEHAFNESLVALLGSLQANLTVQLVLTPARH